MPIFIRRQNKSIRNPHKRKFSGFKLGIFCLIFFSLFLGVFFVYLGQANSSADKGYYMQELETEIKDLKNENEQIKLRVAEWKARNKIEDQLVHLQMIKSNDVVYLKPSEKVFASNWP